MPSVTDVIIAASSVISGIDSADSQLRLRELVKKLEEVDAKVRTLRDENEALASKLRRRKDLERISGSYFIIERDGLDYQSDRHCSKTDEVTQGEWWTQPGPCSFYRKGSDVVITDVNGIFVTVMKGGAENKRYRATVSS